MRARSSRESIGLVRYASAPSLQPRLDRVRLAPRGGEHDDRRAAAAARAQPAQHLDAVEPRHRHVEQHELRLALVDLAQRVDAAARGADAVAVLREKAS